MCHDPPDKPPEMPPGPMPPEVSSPHSFPDE